MHQNVSINVTIGDIIQKWRYQQDWFSVVEFYVKIRNVAKFLRLSLCEAAANRGSPIDNIARADLRAIDSPKATGLTCSFKVVIEPFFGAVVVELASPRQQKDDVVSDERNKV